MREQWPPEAKRIADSSGTVERRDRRLRLRLDDGRHAELVDCPHTDAAFAYLYERYDDTGRFYVAQRPTYEDSYYTLVMKKTGKTYIVEGPPIWSDDKSRFLTARCGIGYPVNTLSVHVPSGGDITTEAEIPLPCGENESCSARWDNSSSIRVTCKAMTDLDGPKPDPQFAVQRGSDGAWKMSDR